MKFYEFLKRIILHKDFSDKYAELEKKINYHFKDKRLLVFALTHSSKEYDSLNHSHFERMEFLGDSVLGLVVSEMLFHAFPNCDEGELTKKKSKLVSRKYLSAKAEEMNLANYILQTRVNNISGAKTIMGNALESLIAAIYLDGGIVPADKFIKKFILKDYKKILTDDFLKNYKSIIQEYTQKHYHNTPVYKLIDSQGPDHKKTFTISISINGKEIAIGKGKNKKTAEQQAAKIACEYLGILDR